MRDEPAQGTVPLHGLGQQHDVPTSGRDLGPDYGRDTRPARRQKAVDAVEPVPVRER
jgi:hypothetical protein